MISNSDSAAARRQALDTVPGLVHCAGQADIQGLLTLWHHTPAPAVTVAGLSRLCAHLLDKIAQHSSADPDEILREFALRLADRQP